MKMFLVTAGRHLGEVWFRNDEDFRVGMNCIAIIAFTCRVKVLAFVLMSNHIHRGGFRCCRPILWDDGDTSGKSMSPSLSLANGA